MRLRDRPRIDLTYCLNIHPGERLADARAALRYAARVRERVAPGAPFGAGLRLGAAAAAELDGPALASFRADLDALGLYAFTVNGFPYGPFHGRPVKAGVYAPDWRAPEREAYTLQLARILAALLPEGLEGSISTVPVGPAPAFAAAAERAAAADRLLDTAAALDALRARTGRLVRLGLEPEPGCLLETAADFLRFAEGDLLGRLPARNRARGARPALDETALRRHLGICLDACHAAVEGESVAGALRALRAAGWPVAKVQLSAALRAPNTAAARRALLAFADPVYLHQVRAFAPGGERRGWNDLDEALAALEGLPAETRLAVHAHVPLFWPGRAPLRSTREAIDAEAWALLRDGAAPHLEIETYTFDALPGALRDRDVVESVAAEFAWVLDRWAGRPEAL